MKSVTGIQNLIKQSSIQMVSEEMNALKMVKQVKGCVRFY